MSISVTEEKFFNLKIVMSALQIEQLGQSLSLQSELMINGEKVVIFIAKESDPIPEEAPSADVVEEVQAEVISE